MEYAFKAAQTAGLTSVGVRGSDCVVVATQKKIKDKLIDASSVTHLFKLSRRIGCVVTGPIADCKAMVARARDEASQFEFDHGYPIPCSYLARVLGDVFQSNTQMAGSRCLAVVMTLCEIDPELGPQLFKVDLAGTCFGYVATSAGTKEQEAQSLLETKLKARPEGEAISADAAAQLAIEVLQTCVGADFKPNEVEVGIVAGKDSTFRVLTDAEVERHLTAISERD